MIRNTLTEIYKLDFVPEKSKIAGEEAEETILYSTNEVAWYISRV